MTNPQRTCLNLPRVFAMSLVWATAEASTQELAVTMSLLGQELDIGSLFTTVSHASTPCCCRLGARVPHSTCASPPHCCTGGRAAE